MACLLQPIRARLVGHSPVNRVGVAPDAAGEPMLCYAGSEESLELLSGLPGMEYWREWDCLALPANRVSLLALETLGQIQEATDEYAALRTRLLVPPLGYAGRYPAPIAGQQEPFQHQVDALATAWHSREQGFTGFGQWAEMGCGKSKWAIDLMRAMEMERAVLVVQNSTALQWQQNLDRLWPDCEAALLVGTSIGKRIQMIREARQKNGPQVLVVNWEAVARLAEELVRYRPEIVVADEASRAKDRNSQMARALHKLGDKTLYKVAMSGTPIGNTPGDLWSLYRFVDCRVFGKSYGKFMERYFRLGGFTGKEFIGFNPQTVGELIEKMYSCAHRTTKAAVGDMPEKLRETIRVRMLPDQRKVYDQVKKDLYATLTTEEGQKTLTVANVLSQAVRLQQITAGLFPTNDPEAEPVQLPSAKTLWLLGYLKEKLPGSDLKVVVWTRFRHELETICRGLIMEGFAPEEFGYIDGSVKMKDRERLREQFNQRESELKILVMQLQAAAYGLDIPSADLLIYHSSTWSHIERAQSEDRGHRLGRTRPYQILDLVCEKSVDETILKALQEKQQLSDLLLMKGVAAIDKIG